MKFKIALLGLVLLVSCKKNGEQADAYGNFTVKEILVSAETAGKAMMSIVQEGANFREGEAVLIIDTTQYILRIAELEAKKQAVDSKKANLQAQIGVLEQQKRNAIRDKQRISNMLQDGAATQKQLDDVEGQLDVLDLQIKTIQTNYSSIQAEAAAFTAGIDQVNDMIKRSKITAPVTGVVLNSYIEKGEAVVPGKAVFKIAQIEDMELKAYISGLQLASVKLNQQVRVLIDADENSMKEYTGEIIWISDEAEFTPKNIQTKEERISQVYALKILVKNDGFLKINMPAEVFFNKALQND